MISVTDMHLLATMATPAFLTEMIASAPKGTIRLVVDPSLEGAIDKEGRSVRWVPMNPRTILVSPSFMMEIKERIL